MGALWIWLAIVAAGEAVMLTDEEYYQMPKLFQLDDYEECLAKPGGAFCLGSFELASRTNNNLMRLVQEYTNNRYHFNRTRIHRGLCLTSTCSHIDQEAMPVRFEACVDNLTRVHHGLEAHMYQLDYCETATTPTVAPIDEVDMTFAYIVLLILIGNVVGTAYDILRNPDNKPNQYLMPWSLRVNWNRLTASYEDGDPRLNSLNSVHGIKAMNMMFVMMAHAIIAYHMTYISNPQFLENGSQHPLATILHNGSVIVQTFIMLSSFLLAYNLLLYREKNPEKGLGLFLFPKVVLQRVTRITPLHMFMVGLAATWWRAASCGPMWALVRAEGARCRDKWWVQALYLQNIVRPDDKCLLQTWFLAVDMQLYIVAAFLILLLGNRPRLAVKVLAGLLVAAVVANFAVAYTWDLKPILFVTYPELMRHQYTGEPSFNWLYTAPWGSFPASIIGMIVAFVYYNLQQDGIKLDEKRWYRILYRLSIPALAVWIFAGYYIKEISSKEGIALYAAIDRPVFTAIVATCMIGFFFKIDQKAWRMMSWGGWRPLSRMSLSVLMLHWSYTLTQLTVKDTLARTSVYEIAGHLFVTMILTYLSSVPLHLLVELPLQKFLQVLFIR